MLGKCLCATEGDVQLQVEYAKWCTEIYSSVNCKSQLAVVTDP